MHREAALLQRDDSQGDRESAGGKRTDGPSPLGGGQSVAVRRPRADGTVVADDPGVIPGQDARQKEKVELS